MLNTAVIIAGGRGSRLMPETRDMPKAMVPVLGRPIIEWILLWLKENGVRKVVISVDHKKDVLRNHLGNGKKIGLQILYNDHTGCKETGDVFRNILENVKLPKTFLAMNGDQITDLAIQDLVAHHKLYSPVATLVACPVRMPYGILEIDDEHTIQKFREKPTLPNVLMNTGIYVFHKSILDYLPRRGSIEKTTFRKLAKEGKLKTYVHKGLFLTINTHKDLEESQKILKNKVKSL